MTHPHKPSPLSTCTGRTKAKRLKWKAKWLANRAARSALNAEYRGEKGNPAMFHAKLIALAMGTGA